MLRMKTKLAALLLIATASPGSASAAEWYRLGMSPNKSYIVYSDATSIEVDKAGLKSAWFDTYYASAKLGPFGADSSQDHDEFDCAARTMRVITSIYYPPGGGPPRTGQPEAAGAPIEPGTVGEAKLIFTCAPDHGGLKSFTFTAKSPDLRTATRLAFAEVRGKPLHRKIRTHKAP